MRTKGRGLLQHLKNLSRLQGSQQVAYTIQMLLFTMAELWNEFDNKHVDVEAEHSVVSVFIRCES